MREVQVMMLAAGLGTRLWPLTADRGKPAVPFLGRPLIRGLLDWLVEHGAERVVVNTHHRPDSIRAALADPPNGVRIAFSHEPSILGTAGGLARARETGLLAPGRTTLVVNAKLVTNIDLTDAFSAHRSAGAEVTMVLRPNLDREAFTTVRVDGSRVTGFGPSRVPEGPTPLAFTGVHFLEPSVLARAEARFSDTVRDLYPPLIAARRVLAHIDATARWDEASTLARYLELQLVALDAGAGVRAPDARIDPASTADRVWVGPDAQIGAGARVTRTVLGPGSWVGADAVIEDAIVWPGARIGPGAQVRRAVLGEGVEVPPGARLEEVAAVRPELARDPPEGRAPAGLRSGLAVVPVEPST